MVVLGIPDSEVEAIDLREVVVDSRLGSIRMVPIHTVLVVALVHWVQELDLAVVEVCCFLPMLATLP